MRGAGRSAARQAGAPLIRLRCAQAPSPTGGEGGNRFTATANHHRSRLTEALLSRLSFSPCGRRWPSRSEAQARSDEGCWTERGAPSWSTPHPPSLRSGTFSHRGRRGNRFIATPITTVRDWLKRCYRALLLPLVGEGGRAEAKRRRGRMRGAGRSAARQAGTPPIRLGFEHRDEENRKFFIHALSASRIISGIALTGTWCAPGIREGGGAGPVAWRKRGWKFSSEARARFAAPPHRQRPPRGPRRSGKTTGGALGRRHTFTLRGTDPAPRFPTASTARRESGRGNGEACVRKPPLPA